MICAEPHFLPRAIQPYGGGRCSHHGGIFYFAPNFHQSQLLLPCKAGNSILSHKFVRLTVFKTLSVHIRLSPTIHKQDYILSLTAES